MSVLAVMTFRVLRARRAAPVRRRRKAPARNVVGSRSFLVDVHVLGR
jgi:hypothetical protein